MEADNIRANATKLTHHRYCQALMKARSGEHVLLDAEGISCPAAAAAFGFKSLPQGLQTGKSLQGFGIVQQADTGKRMFEGMKRLEQGTLQALYLFPLEEAAIASQYRHYRRRDRKIDVDRSGQAEPAGRRTSTTAVLQATCVDATLIPFVQKKFNMSFGWYGCRDATDIGPNETVLSFPFNELERIAETIKFLQKKAIPNSRGKNALALLRRKETDQIEKTDPFNE